MANTPEYNLPSNAYTNFDATSLKSFMIERLNEGGQFTDQNYEGSNISSLLDILAYYTHVLMFYLNQTSSESSFSQTSIYENMNRIVKLIGYKPTGKQTSMISVDCQASSQLSQGNYTIRKYSYFLIDNIQYTFPSDQFFEKTTSNNENIESISNTSILYQGTVGEYPTYIAQGIEFESFPIVVDNLVSTNDTKFISHGTISVYVKEASNNTWVEYLEVDSLFLSKSVDRVYELRLNENGHYEIKFGNGVFGKSLSLNDTVNVFYILSDGAKGQISKNAINGNKLFIYNSSKFNEIYSNVSSIYTSTTIDKSKSANLTFSNPSNSTVIRDGETVEEIRQNSSVFLSNQLRLVTESDYERFLNKTIPNVLNDVRVVNNETYINGYISYFYEICVDPNKVNRVILNQVNFADSCDFNNVNIFCVPRFLNIIDGQYPEFISNNFKNLIVDLTKDKKMISDTIVPRDPLYMAIDIGTTNKTVSKNIYPDCKLIITRSKNDKTNKSFIKTNVINILLDYFDPENIKLGQTIDMTEITSRLSKISGIKKIRTYNQTDDIYFDGVSFVMWNPLFEGVDETIINQTTILPYFKFPYLYNPQTISNRIDVINE
jgi:hypothetical protein